MDEQTTDVTSTHVESAANFDGDLDEKSVRDADQLKSGGKTDTLACEFLVKDDKLIASDCDDLTLVSDFTGWLYLGCPDDRLDALEFLVLLLIFVMLGVGIGHSVGSVSTHLLHRKTEAFNATNQKLLHAMITECRQENNRLQNHNRQLEDKLKREFTEINENLQMKNRKLQHQTDLFVNVLAETLLKEEELLQTIRNLKNVTNVPKEKYGGKLKEDIPMSENMERGRKSETPYDIVPHVLSGVVSLKLTLKKMPELLNELSSLCLDQPNQQTGQKIKERSYISPLHWGYWDTSQKSGERSGNLHPHKPDQNISQKPREMSKNENLNHRSKKMQEILKKANESASGACRQLEVILTQLKHQSGNSLNNIYQRNDETATNIHETEDEEVDPPKIDHGKENQKHSVDGNKILESTDIESRLVTKRRTSLQKGSFDPNNHYSPYEKLQIKLKVKYWKELANLGDIMKNDSEDDFCKNIKSFLRKWSHSDFWFNEDPAIKSKWMLYRAGCDF